MKPNELYHQNLKDWVLIEGFHMELHHTLMGYFPLIELKSDKMVLALTVPDLKEAWEALPKKKVKIHRELILLNRKTKEFVMLGKSTNSESFFLVLTGKGEVEKLLKQERLRYARGLLSFKDESNAVFPSLEEAW